MVEPTAQEVAQEILSTTLDGLILPGWRTHALNALTRTLTTFAARQVAQATRETCGEAARMYCDLCKMRLSERRLDGEWVHHSRNLAANNVDDAFCESPEFRRRAQEVL